MAFNHIAIPQNGDGSNSKPLQVDGSGNLLVNIAQGSFAVTTGAQYNSTPPTLTSGSTGPLQSDVNGKLLIAGTINATSAATYNSATQSFTSGTSNALQSDAHGSLLVTQRDASGAVQGGLANPLRMDPTGTTTQPVSISGSVPVTGTFWQATQPVSFSSTVTIKADTAGNQANALKVDGSAVTQPVSGSVSVSNLPATQAISAAALPLPSGAATSAKQPALGTAGAASSDVLTVQGVASMTALKVDGSAVTQPVSGSVSVSNFPGSQAVTGTFWQATQPVSGSVSVSNFPGSQAVTGTFWQATQPVSGSVSVSNFPGSQAVTGTFWQATQPVSIAATVTTSSVPATTGGLSATKLISAATTNATSVKASAGQLYNVQAFNTNAAARYLKLYNKASAPTVGTDTPVATYLIPGAAAGAGCVIEISNGFAFATGLAFALTTGLADSDTGAVGANDCVVNLQYK